MRTGMPFIGMKIAQTLDGYIADHRGRSKWITSEQARKEAHRIRAQYDAILVGANTVIEDNPRLTVRAAKGRNPVRIVLDGQLRVPAHARIFSTRLARTILFTTQRALLRKRSTVSRLTERGVQVLALESARGMDEHAILRSLGALGISSILVEGGSTTASGFLQKKLVNRLHCFVAPKITGGGLHAVVLKPALELPKAIQMSADGIRLIGSDLLVEGRLVYS
jgi:diaminohydroxyphosphoribosylaminopyrimidine deaminase/5-amino-6-(5-phosphoribosylamino)uracil reductase